ncbi:AAA family ATPase [Streptomyces sp. NBC_01506]|uniref:AAA family ATPase n=1 Tax=Streptomyces sp. NBC_01506 TaxID=2903887 RepID=UPI003864BF03
MSEEESPVSTELRSAVVLVTGVMASGKSTVAGLLAGQLPRAAHVRGDTFRRMLVSGREELLPEETAEARAQMDLRRRITATVADAYADDNWTAVVQDIVIGEDLSRFVAEVRARPLYVVVLAPSIEAVRSREDTRPKTGYGVWTVEALDHSLRTHTPRIGLWLDTTKQTPQETVSAILADLPAALVTTESR